MSMDKKKPNPISEMWRKFLVALKRRPQMIPMVALVITFVVYSFNLTVISNTTARIQGSGMGLAGFATMLFSMLSFLCCLNAFPYRKKPVIPMVVLLYVMLAIIAFADYSYLNAIAYAIARPDNPVVVTTQTAYIAWADYYLRIHLVLLAVSAVLVALLPVYTKLLRKINTNIEVEDNGEMGAIDISAE